MLIAAWFHDTRYIEGCSNHEDSSIVIASDFLLENGKSTDYIVKVAGLIKATKKEYIPQTLSEKIIKDADYYHILNDDYIFSCEGLRNEWENIEGKSFTDKDWAVENLNFLTNIHRFYKDYALENWQPLKDKNIKHLQKKLKKMNLKTNNEFDKEYKKKKRR